MYIYFSITHIFLLGAFDEEEIIHVEGDVDPARDLDIIHSELRFKDLEYLHKQLDPLEKSVARGADKHRKAEHVSILLIDNLNQIYLKVIFFFKYK